MNENWIKLNKQTWNKIKQTNMKTYFPLFRIINHFNPFFSFFFRLCSKMPFSCGCNYFKSKSLSLWYPCLCLFVLCLFMFVCLFVMFFDLIWFVLFFVLSLCLYCIWFCLFVYVCVVFGFVCLFMFVFVFFMLCLFVFVYVCNFLLITLLNAIKPRAAVGFDFISIKGLVLKYTIPCGFVSTKQ